MPIARGSADSFSPAARRSATSISSRIRRWRTASEHRLGRRLGEPVEQLRRAGDVAPADRVGERPDRARDGLRDERLDVRRPSTGAVGPVERELVELAVGDHRLVPAVGVVVASRTPPIRVASARAAPGPRRMPALARLGLDPARELAGLRRLEAADLAAGRLDRRRRAASARARGRRSATPRRRRRRCPARRAAGARGARRGPRCGRSARRRSSRPRASRRRTSTASRPAAGARPIWTRGLVAVAADLDPLDGAAVLRPEGRRHPGDGAARREVVVAPEVGDRRGRVERRRQGRWSSRGRSRIAAPPTRRTGAAAAQPRRGSGLDAPAIDAPGAARRRPWHRHRGLAADRPTVDRHPIEPSVSVRRTRASRAQPVDRRPRPGGRRGCPRRPTRSRPARPDRRRGTPRVDAVALPWWATFRKSIRRQAAAQRGSGRRRPRRRRSAGTAGRRPRRAARSRRR